MREDAQATTDAVSAPVGVCLLFATGFTDAYVYLRQGHVFAQAMTGNLVLFAARVTGSSRGPFWYPAVVVVAFVCGVSALWAWNHLGGGSGRRDRLATVGLLVLMLLVAGIAGQAVPHPLIAVGVAFCGGMEISAFRRVGATHVTPVVMTTDTFRAVIAALEAITDREAREAAATLLVSVASFALGAIAGAVVTQAIHDRAALVAAVAFAVTFGLLARPRRAGAH